MISKLFRINGQILFNSYLPSGVVGDCFATKPSARTRNRWMGYIKVGTGLGTPRASQQKIYTLQAFDLRHEPGSAHK
jgi:hypothetical protein